MSKITLINNDCIEAMKEMWDNSVDSIVTDPPYELGFMGKSWDSTGIAFNVEVWEEALRVLKPGGHLIAFSGSRTYHRMAVAIEDAGFEIRDQIMWVYGSGFPKSMNIGKQLDDWQGWGTALKPAHEPMVLARKPVVGTIANNVLTHGVGGLNIDASRVEGDKGTGNWKGVTTPDQSDNIYAGGWDGSVQSIEPITDDGTIGRFPANFIHDGSDEVVGLFPESNGAGGSVPNVKITGYGDGIGSGESVYTPNDRKGFNSGSGSAARFFYCAKTSKRDRNEGLEGFEAVNASEMVNRKEDSAGMNSPRAGAGRTNGAANHHPTVKPTSLMQYLVRLVTPPNGTVLDPFMGSGSTGKACAYEGFDFIGIDQSAEYVEIAKARINFALENKNADI